MYVNRIDIIIQEIKTQDKSFNGIIDSVLIDGRFRVACVLKILQSKYVFHNKSIILIDDYFVTHKTNPQTHNYTIVEKYYDIIYGASEFGTLAAFTPKIMTDDLLVSIQNDLNTYMTIAE